MTEKSCNYHNFISLTIFFLFCRLVLNLMTINIVSCLTLFPAILFDLSLSADVEKPSPSQQSPNDFPSQEPLMIESSDNGNTSTKFSYSSTLSPMGVCIWSTVMSSVVAHVSLFAMMSIGKWIRVYTVWKFYDFSITHILREINPTESGS